MTDAGLKGKRALVTGASQGMGRAIAIELARQGAEVIALAFPEAGLPELVAEVPSIRFVVCDLSKWEETEKIIKQLLPIQLLVNNAGVLSSQPFVEIDETDFDKIFSVNVKAIINVSKIVGADLMARNEKGSIVNMSSVASFIGATDYTLYCASKATVNSLTRNLALEFGRKGIRANAVCPLPVNTAMGRQLLGPNMEGFESVFASRVPLGRFAEVEDIVPLVRFLLSDEASMINGTCIPVDGGMMSSGP